VPRSHRPSTASSRRDSVAQSTRQIVSLAPLAAKPRAVWAPSGSADAVTADAELFTRATMTSGARCRVDARLGPVVASAAPRAYPPQRVRATRCRARTDMTAVMAPLTRILAVTRRAQAGVGASLIRVSRDEACAVKARERDTVECERRWQSRDGADPVAPRAGALGVAARAKVSRARRTRAVLAQPIAIVDEVAYRGRVFGREVLVTAVAVAQWPLIAMLVAAEASGHLRPDHLGALFGHGLVAADAISVRHRLMRSMLKPEMLSREPGVLPHVGRSVAAQARPLVVRFRVTGDARCVRGQMERLDIARRGYALVACDAVDPVRRVRAMLEGVRRVTRAEAENSRARCEREACDDDERERALHSAPQCRERRARALSS
jgi:hypothetical protein